MNTTERVIEVLTKRNIKWRKSMIVVDDDNVNNYNEHDHDHHDDGNIKNYDVINIKSKFILYDNHWL